MKTIYTAVLIKKSGKLFTVSFLDKESAIAYCVAEAYYEQGFEPFDDPDWGDHVYFDLEQKGFYESNLGNKYYIEEAELYDKYDV